MIASPCGVPPAMDTDDRLARCVRSGAIDRDRKRGFLRSGSGHAAERHQCRDGDHDRRDPSRTQAPCREHARPPRSAPRAHGRDPTLTHSGSSHSRTAAAGRCRSVRGGPGRRVRPPHRARSRCATAPGTRRCSTPRFARRWCRSFECADFVLEAVRSVDVDAVVAAHDDAPVDEMYVDLSTRSIRHDEVARCVVPRREHVEPVRRHQRAVPIGVEVIDHEVEIVVRTRLRTEQRVDTPPAIHPHLDAGADEDIEHHEHVGIPHHFGRITSYRAPKSWPAPAATTGRADAQDVAGREVDGALVGERFGARLVARPEQPVLPARAGVAAGETPRS